MTTRLNAVYYKRYTDSDGNDKSFAYKVGTAFSHNDPEHPEKDRVDVILDVMPPLGATISIFKPRPKQNDDSKM